MLATNKYTTFGALNPGDWFYVYRGKSPWVKMDEDNPNMGVTILTGTTDRFRDDEVVQKIVKNIVEPAWSTSEN